MLLYLSTGFMSLNLYLCPSTYYTIDHFSHTMDILLLLQFVLLFDWVNFETLKYGKYEYPFWANAIGWFISVYVVLPIPIVAIYKLVKARGYTCSKKLVRITPAAAVNVMKVRLYRDKF